MAKNDLAPPAGDMTCKSDAIYRAVVKHGIDERARLRSALIELGHALSKCELPIACRRHVEMFWDIIKERG